MFGFHTRSKSLIPVSDLEKLEEKHVERIADRKELEAEEESEPQTPRARRNITMIYLLFLAEAIMAASLSSQITIIFPSSSACVDMNTSFLRSILQCAYYFGSFSGILWGHLADKLGRRRVALAGLYGMCACCLSMGFATSFTAFCILRYIAGAISSAATVSGLAMLADRTHGSKTRVRAIARLPLLVVCGQMGPLLSNAIRQFAQNHLEGIFAEFPALSGQIACSLLVLIITVAETLLLEETLPGSTAQEDRGENFDCEKVAFLDQRLSTDSEPAISIIEALNDDAAAPRPSRITISQMLTAPTILTLLASYALLSLHTSTFEIMLPHVGHTATHHGGMGLPCSWLQPILLVVKVVAAIRIMQVVPLLAQRVGVLPCYQRISMAFPLLYVVIPLAGLAVSATGASNWLAAIISVFTTLVKTTLAGAAQVLVVLLIVSAAPDASSTGTLIGVISISELFKALAVGVTSISYFVSDDYSMLAINGSLWTALAAIALVGAVITQKLRETPRVGTDLPSECFLWQGLFDVETDDEEGF